MTVKRTQARPYAKAAFLIAKEGNDFSGWAEALNRLAQVVTQPAVKAFIQNQTISPENVASLLIGAMTHYLKEEERQFIRVLAETKRILLLPEILGLYLELKAEAESTVEVKVTSAVVMSAQQEQALTEKLMKKFSRTVVLRCEVEPDILGGLIIRAGNRVIDASLKGQFNQLQERLGVHHDI